MAQGELGGFEVVLPSEPLSEPKFTELPQEHKNAHIQMPNQMCGHTYFKNSQNLEKPVLEVAKQDDSLWKNASNLNDFYEALRKHSLYTKAMRSSSFCIPTKIKTNVPYFLIFHSPLELTVEARDILERLFKKLDVDLNICGVSFFLKCKDVALPREKNILKEMLCKEIELVNPEKIIFFREVPKPEKIETSPLISGNIATFAGKPAITLYSLLEILPGKPDVKEKMSEVLYICQTHLK